MLGQNELVYLKKELGFSLGEWNKLDEATKQWYRAAAKAEMEHIANAGK